jgi:hypothetical protein
LGGKKVGEEDRRMDGHNHHMVYAYKEISQWLPIICTINMYY